jgi:hypothetical protein
VSDSGLGGDPRQFPRKKVIIYQNIKCKILNYSSYKIFIAVYDD